MTTNCIDQSRVGSNDYISQSRQEEWVEVEVSGGEEEVAGKQVKMDWHTRPRATTAKTALQLYYYDYEYYPRQDETTERTSA